MWGACMMYFPQEPHCQFVRHCGTFLFESPMLHLAPLAIPAFSSAAVVRGNSPFSLRQNSF